MDEVCPWFHPNNIHSFLDYKQESQIPILPPNSDHEYSGKKETKVVGIIPHIIEIYLFTDYSLKRLNKREKAPNTTTLMREELKVIKDCRYCKLCGKRGDALPTRAGRLLHLRLDDWIHVRFVYGNSFEDFLFKTEGPLFQLCFVVVGGL